MIDTASCDVQALRSATIDEATDVCQCGLERKGQVTRRERFLAEMDAVIPWARLLAFIEPHYPKAGAGRQPHPMQRMLRIYFMQNLFSKIMCKDAVMVALGLQAPVARSVIEQAQ